MRTDDIDGAIVEMLRLQSLSQHEILEEFALRHNFKDQDSVKKSIEFLQADGVIRQAENNKWSLINPNHKYTSPGWD